MSTFHFSKIIAGVSPMLAKETVLSKIINMVDGFRISLGGGFDDNNKKYIDTLMKLDNSKTIILETRGNDIRIKNVVNLKVKDKQQIEVEYSEYAQEQNQKIFIDTPLIGTVKPGQIISLQQSGISMKVKSIRGENALCEIIKGGDILQYDKVVFENYDLDIPFFAEREKKDILRGLEYGVHVIAASLINSAADIYELKEFLASRSAEKMKVLAKIETAEGLKRHKEIIEASDGIILVIDKLKPLSKDIKAQEELIVKTCKNIGKPIIITLGEETKTGYNHFSDAEIKKCTECGIDCYMLNTFLTEEETFQTIEKLLHTLEKSETKVKPEENIDFYKTNDDFMVRDYIIYNAHRITSEIDVKAMVSFTENGYTTSRISSLAPRVPVIAFTKIDETYRYINLLRGVRGYKISQSFDYENLKRVGKEMIRIIFKGNISLDDKIVIVQANEIIKDEKTDMINGVELYKFKNI